MKCKHCGKENIKYPIRDSEGKLIVKNLFKMDLMSVIFLLIVLSLLFSYNQNIEQCRDMAERPVEFCWDNGICNITNYGISKPDYTLIQVPKVTKATNEG